MSGPSEDYNDADEAELEAALDRAATDFDNGYGGRRPRRLTIRAQVEWAGVKDKANDGVRTVNLDQLDLAKVQAALVVARQANAGAARAGNSLQAKSWQAQLHELVGNRRATAATERAGLSPTKETLIKWLSGRADPNPANQRRIEAAYRDVRDQVVTEARTKAAAANHQVAQALNEAIEDRYSQAVRFRHITRAEFGD